MSSNAQAKMLREMTSGGRAWSEMIAAACFAEELDLEALPLPEGIKSDVRSILGELARLSPLEALSRCISNPGELLLREV
jgi:hypothetical protein